MVKRALQGMIWIALVGVLFFACELESERGPSPGFKPEGNLTHSLLIEVGMGGVVRYDKPVTVNLELTRLLRAQGFELRPDPRSIRVREVDSDAGLEDGVVFQFDLAQGSGTGREVSGILTFVMQGISGVGETRRFEVCFGPEGGHYDEPVFSKQVVVEDHIQHAGFQSFRLITPFATYFYHKQGSAFASMIDPDGNDWISYKPEGGAEGSYRGIPNVAPGGFHPGPGEGNRVSSIQTAGPLRAELNSETIDGKWACTWNIYPSYAVMTLEQASDPYWMLYEGTPGGEFTVADYWVDSSGRRFDSGPFTLENKWNGDLPDPEWVYFVDPLLDRALYLVHHEPSQEVDEYWHFGDGGMTVFGFGRGPKEVAWQRLLKVPARLTIGLVESKEFDEVKSCIESAFRPLQLELGNIHELKPR